LTIRRECDLLWKFNHFKKQATLPDREEFDEKNLSTQQLEAKKDPRIFGKDEHQKWSKCIKKEKAKGEKKVNGLGPKILEDGELNNEKDGECVDGRLD